MINLKLQNANKLAYLIKCYPDKKVSEILDIIQMPPVQSNAGLWLAQELSWVTEYKDDKIEFLKAPDKWEFGDTIEDLMDMLTYCFKRLEKDQTDLEEKFFSDWVYGYATQDVIVATKYLIEERVLAEYEIVDKGSVGGESTYLFYTLFENLEKEWGRKQFKRDPNEEVEADEFEDDTPEEDKHLGEDNATNV